MTIIYTLHHIQWVAPCAEFPQGTTRDVIIGYYSTKDNATSIKTLFVDENSNRTEDCDFYIGQVTLDLNPVTGESI